MLYIFIGWQGKLDLLHSEYKYKSLFCAPESNMSIIPKKKKGHANDLHNFMHITGFQWNTFKKPPLSLLNPLMSTILWKQILRTAHFPLWQPTCAWYLAGPKWTELNNQEEKKVYLLLFLVNIYDNFNQFL